MVLNYIWIAFFVIAFIIALIKVIFLGDTEIFTAIMNSTFDSSKTAFEISLGLTGVLALWLGIMKIGENSGLINALARFLSPVLCRLFPDIPKGHPVLGSIFMNMSANMLGLPIGTQSDERTARTEPEERYGFQSDDHVSGYQYFRPHHHPDQYHGIPCADGGCPAYGCVYPYPAEYFYLDSGRCHSRQYRPEDQSDQQAYPDIDGRYLPFLLRIDLSVSEYFA